MGNEGKKTERARGGSSSRKFARIEVFIYKMIMLVVAVFLLVFPLLKYESENALILVNPITKEARVFELEKDESTDRYIVKKETDCKMAKITEEDKTYYAFPIDGVLAVRYETRATGSFKLIFGRGQFGFGDCIKAYFFGGTNI